MDAISYTFRLATEDDEQAVFDLVFRNPPKFVRRRPRSQVLSFVRAGSLWVACDESGQVVGACYITIPEAQDADTKPDPAEWGGLVVSEALEGRGIGSALATLSLACFFWDHDPDSLTPPRLIGHVHKDNPGPRGILERHSFELKGEIEVPEGMEGFEHMPRNADNKLIGDEFEYPPPARSPLFLAMARLLRESRLKTLRIAIEPSLGMTAESLEEVATRLDALARG